MPNSVFSAGGGRSSVGAWKTTALDIEEVLSGAVDSDNHLFVADVISHSTLLIVASWIGFKEVWGCLLGSGMLTLSIMSGCGLDLLLVWVSPRLVMGGIPQGCPLSM